LSPRSSRPTIRAGAVAAGLLFAPTASAAQAIAAPDTLTVTSGTLALTALLWRPVGAGPFPAVFFIHGSYGSDDPAPTTEPGEIGRVFARHGYVLLYLFRQGIGLSAGQGTSDGDLMDRAMVSNGLEGRNREQLELLNGDELAEALAGLAALRRLPEVDPNRVAVVGHSFGGSLTLLVATHDTTVRAAVVFGCAAASWDRSPALRARLLAAVAGISAPVFFVHAANDYSVAPGRALATEMQRLGRAHVLRIFPPFGQTPREGHNLVYLGVATWEPPVFAFLDDRLRH